MRPVSEVELPALAGTDALGFLAALGVLRIVSERVDARAALAFSRMSANAVLHSALGSVDEVAAALRGEVERVPEGGLVPGALGFPLRKEGSATDPMRRPRPEFPQMLERLSGIDANVRDTWLPALVTDLAVEGAGERAVLTPYTAPSGQQSLGTFFEKSLGFVRRRPEYLDEALNGWRRAGDSKRNEFSGEYLDHRAIRNAADNPGGESLEAGVPGATWLAIMALPLLRVTGDGKRVAATCWYRVRRRSVMVWPVWGRPLDVAAVVALLEYPWRPSWKAPDGYVVSRATADAYDVFAMGGARRQRLEGRNFAGVLAPVQVKLEAS